MTRTGVREMASVARVLARGKLGRYARRGLGMTARFESEVADFLDSPHTLAVNSGTSALMCALAGVGVGPGDEVLVPAYTWISSAAAPLALGAVPVLVEVDESLTIDPVDMKAKITPATKAVIPVHMLNLVCDLDAIVSLAAANGIAVVEDACQAFGVRYRGRRVGTVGDAGAFSFSQTKNITAGEGGLVTTADSRIAARAGMLHDVGSYTRAGWAPTNEPLFVG
jgi:dTDP-4-amino-4,6-dideoxygalactose transaminase